MTFAVRRSDAAMLAILKKDLRIEFRSKAGLSSLFVLGLLVLLVFEFALAAKPTVEVGVAALWLSFLFAGTLGAQRTMLIERDNLSIYGLLTAPVDPAAIFVAKMLGNLVTLTILQAVVAPLSALFFELPLGAHPAWLALVCFLGNAGFSAVATLFAAVSVRTRAREMMLPLLVFPLVVPLLIAAVKGSVVLAGGGGAAEASVWIQVLVAFDVIFVVAGWLLFEAVVRE